MRSLALGIATACLAIGAAAAQPTNTTNGTGTPPVPVPGINHDRAAASGNSNQAVATTDANAANPAKGANSFTASQARARIEKQGFSNVTDLRKDDDGVWRGHGQKSGQTVAVWLDYKGNVGQ